MAVSQALLQNLQIAIDDLLEQQIILRDMRIRILQWQNLVRPVLGDSVSAVNAKNPPLREAVKREDVVVGHAPQLHVVAVHQIKKIDTGLHPLLLVAQLLTYHVDICSEIIPLTLVHWQSSPLRRLCKFLH